jgi:hypothetical protein
VCVGDLTRYSCHDIPLIPVGQGDQRNCHGQVEGVIGVVCCDRDDCVLVFVMCTISCSRAQAWEFDAFVESEKSLTASFASMFETFQVMQIACA